MNFDIVSGVNKKHLRISGNYEIHAAYEKKIIEDNTFSYFLNMTDIQDDDIHRWDYDITSMECLRSIGEKRGISFDFLKIIVNSLIYVCKETKEYLLCEGGIIFDPKYIYYDEKNRKLLFCYLPGRSQNIYEEINLLGDFLIENVDYNDKNTVEITYKIYDHIQNENYAFEQIMLDYQNNSFEVVETINTVDEIDEDYSKMTYEVESEGFSMPLKICVGICFGIVFVILGYFIYLFITGKFIVNMSNKGAVSVTLTGICILAFGIFYFMLEKRNTAQHNKRISLMKELAKKE